MKFRCEREALAEALSTAGRAATGRTGALPVLSGLRLELAGDQLSITGTDLDLTIQLTLPVGGDGDGGVVLPARLATDIVRSMGSGKVEVIVDGDEVNISGGRSQFSVRPLSLDDYPKLAAPATSSVTLPAAAVGEALRQVVRAASTDEARPILTGVLLTAENGGLRMVATDSYRLAVRDLADHEVLGADQKVLVPGRALNELQRLVGGGDDLTMRLGDRDATFEVGGTRLSTRLIEGEFPNYRQLIPASHPNTLTVAREPLLEAIRRVKILAKDATPVRLQMGGDTLRLTAITQDVGNASEELDATYEGADLTVAFNPEYLASGVEACTADEITLSTLDSLKPAVVRGVGADDYLYLLMPVRVP
ncbi:MAG TPA: DNA polymerase III subunit beta [Ilumatobacteraceae bacterium]|nr:DNA polymerase III subunit beta [Ilumatobacteraceae bacterium]